MGGEWTSWLGPSEWQAVRLSIKVSVWAVVASLPLGILVAYALARWRFPGHGLLNGLVHLPLVLPPVVTGYLLLLTFGRHGWIGGWLESWWGIRLVFDWKGAALASARRAKTARETSPRACAPKASASSASPTRIAFASPYFTCTVGRPRRRSSSSIAGRSSWTSE